MKSNTLSILGMLFLAAAAPGLRAQGVTVPEEQKVVKVLRTTNKAQTQHYVAKAYEMKNNNPFQVRRFLQRPLAVEEGGLFTYLAPDGKSGNVMLILPEHQIPYYDDLMKVLDSESVSTADGSSRTFTKLKHRSVADADFIATLASYLTTDSFLYTDDELNGVYISDIPSGANTALAMLEGDLDASCDQVTVEVTIYEVDANNDARIGLDYHAWKNGPGRTLFAVGGFGESGAELVGLPGEVFDSNGVNTSYQLTVPSAYFDFLAVRGKARILTSTRLSMPNTGSASTSTGDQILYWLTQNGAAPAGAYGEADEVPDNRTVVGQLASRALDAVETGVALEVTAIIGTERINLEVSYDTVVLNAFDGEGRPQLASTHASGKFNLKSGEEVILGGMSRRAEIKRNTQIPILGSLPIVGYLFGGETSTVRETMLVIAVKPVRIENFTNYSLTDPELVAQAEGGPVSLPPDDYAWDQFLIGEAN